MVQFYLSHSRVLIFSLLVTTPLFLWQMPEAWGAGARSEVRSETPHRMGPAASALGGAGRATVDDGEAGWLNPAALPHLGAYEIGLSHQQSNRTGGDHYRDFAIHLMDGGEGKLAAGSLSYVQRDYALGGAAVPTGAHAKSRDFQVSLAGFFNKSRVSLGFTYRHYIFEQPGLAKNQDNMSIGLLYPVSESFGVGIVGQDILNSADNVPDAARLIPNAGVGIYFSPISILRLRTDIVRRFEVNPEDVNDVHVGLESWFDPEFAFRLGSSWLESQNEHWLTAGLAFKGPKLSVGYAFESQIRDNAFGGVGDTRHTFDLWLPL